MMTSPRLQDDKNCDWGFRFFKQFKLYWVIRNSKKIIFPTFIIPFPQSEKQAVYLNTIRIRYKPD